MKRYFLIILAVAALVAFNSCNKEIVDDKEKNGTEQGGGGNGGNGGSGEEGGGEEGGGETSEKGFTCITGDAIVSYNSATLLGSFTVPEDFDLKRIRDIMASFELSHSPEFEPEQTTFYPAEEGNEEFSFVADVLNLQENTTYYYRACLVVGISDEKMDIVRGAVKNFTTKMRPRAETEVGEVIDTTEISAVIEAWCNPRPALAAQGYKYGIKIAGSGPYSLYYVDPIEGKDIDEDGRYTVEVSGLTPGDTYYVKSYVYYNSDNTYYLSDNTVSFKTPELHAKVLNLGASGIEESSMTLNGKIQMHTKAKFEVENIRFRLRGASQQWWDTTMKPDSTFSAVATGLVSGASYYLSAYADIGGKTFQSEELEVSTRPIGGTVELLPLKNLTEFGATLSAKFATECAPGISREARFCWTDKPVHVEKAEEIVEGEEGEFCYIIGDDGGRYDVINYLMYIANQVPATIEADGTFSVDLSGLNYNKDYAYLACVRMAEYHECPSEYSVFHTPDIAVDLATLPPSDLTEQSVILKGSINVESVTPFSRKVWFRFSRGANLTREQLLTSSSASSVDEISLDASFSGAWESRQLSVWTGEPYSYMACAKVHDKTVYGNVVTFTAPDVSASVSLSEPESVYENAARVRGQITLQGGATAEKSVTIYYSPTANTREELLNKNWEYSTLNSDMTFTSDLTDLQPGTKYYYVASARVGTKFFYSDVSEFTTSSVTVEAFTPVDVREKSATFKGKLTISGTDDPGKSARIYIQKTSGNWNNDIAAEVSSDGTITATYTTLQPCTEYKYYIWAVVRGKGYSSGYVTFTTSDLLVSPSTPSVSQIEHTYAVFSGSFNVNGSDASELKPHFVFGKTGVGEDNWESVDASVLPDGTYSARPVYLEPASTYTVKFAVTALGRTVKSATGAVFTTKTPTASVPSGAVSLGTFATRDDGSQYEIFWADRNMGAASESDYGGYYSWGELETKDNYIWSTYRWHQYIGSNDSYVTKYIASTATEGWTSEICQPDNLIELLPEDDVATVTLQGNWRMPYEREWAALRDCCNLTWVTRGEVTGMEVRSKASTKTAVLFFPAGGDRQNMENMWGMTLNHDGFYWSKTVNTSNAKLAHATHFYYTWLGYDDQLNQVYGVIVDEHWGFPSRHLGYLVRPVTPGP